MKSIKILLLALAVTLLSGCYANFAAPSLSLAASTDAETAPKIGRASCTQVLWVFFMGDCSLRSAMSAGRIDKLHHVDTEVQMILFGAYSQLTIRAAGE